MRGWGRVAGIIAVSVTVWFAILAAVGLLITKVVEDSYPFTAEDGIDRSLAAHRTPWATAVTGFFSLVGSTWVIIATMLVVAVIFRLMFHRWRESIFLVVAVGAQALVFFLTALVISRDRPDVPKLDSAPPTSSFPSGHTGASTALYVGIAVVVILVWRGRHRWSTRLVVTLLLLVPLAVAVSRLYRGMHHPSDVVAGLLNGGACALIAARTVLSRAQSALGRVRVGRT